MFTSQQLLFNFIDFPGNFALQRTPASPGQENDIARVYDTLDRQILPKFCPLDAVRLRRGPIL
jgi:hypothetical protein